MDLCFSPVSVFLSIILAFLFSTSYVIDLVITKSEEVKLLGVLIDGNVNFTEYISELCTYVLLMSINSSFF